MDREQRRFVREAKRDTKLLIEQCSWIPAVETPDAKIEEIDHETEVILRSSMGGSANLAFFLPYLWKHRH